ncbi:hypothetical protein BaRGS_00022050 [Batillaria attramentaria]|uniref:CCR4-NOT transcription complex subunit 4 n=1 Tax=Batillaria attramentaria TaxID=370345 RepID=A0ABD0KHK3_9CAEN
MSVGDEPVECPLCMEPLEIDDINFFPCTCGYQICRFCWHRIRTDENGLCPACRKQYPEDPAEFKPLTDDELQNIKKERKQKECQRKQKAAENRKHLANVRVVQKNLVFVVGLSPRLADPEVLKKHDYFGKFGKIHKVVINQSTSYAGSQGPSASAYVTYVRVEDALRAILAVNNVHVDGRTLKTSLGTTKYCSHFLRGTQCMKSDCMYLHELGEEAASFTKEEMQMGKHQEYEQKLIEQFLNSQNSANNHVSNNKIQNSRKKSGSPSAQQQHINQQHSPPITEPGAPSSNKPQRLTAPSGHQGAPHSGDPGSSTEAWPSLQPASSKAVGNGRHRSTSENNQQSQDRGGSDVDSTPDSPLGHSKGHFGVDLPPTSLPNHSNTGSSLAVGGSVPKPHSPVEDGPLQPPPPTQMPLPLPQSQQGVLPIGASRRLAAFYPGANNSLSFFSNSILGSKPPPPVQSSAQTERTESQPPTEMTDSIPVSSSTDWSAAFGFKNKETTDDDLGFDPCAESFKGLADLIEKENGRQWGPSHGQMGPMGSDQRSFASHMPQPLPGAMPASSGPSQHSLPPGFSLSHIQQQQLHQQQFFRPELSGSRMMEFMPFGARPRFQPMHNNFHHGPDMGSGPVHHPASQSGPLPQGQPDMFSMKDMQDQLRSLLPNINISFGSPPQLSNAQPPMPPPGVPHSQPGVVRPPTEPAWMANDPAIVCSRPVGDDNPHWLKSIHQLTESDGPAQNNNSRMPFVQQFPLGPGGGWPPQTQNPPPGFRSPVRPATGATEPHKLAEEWVFPGICGGESCSSFMGNFIGNLDLCATCVA